VNAQIPFVTACQHRWFQLLQKLLAQILPYSRQPQSLFSTPQINQVRSKSKVTHPSPGGENLLQNLIFPRRFWIIEELRSDECTGICPKWLLWVAIILGVIVLLLLFVNLFLCSALTCTCTRTELVEKEPSVMEDYDPYRSWAGSQYGGSRYSLNGKPIYSMSAESNGGSDHYATVPSRHSPTRPGSRYSNTATATGQRRGGGGTGGSPLYSHHRKI